MAECTCPDNYKLCVNGCFWTDCVSTTYIDAHAECEDSQCVCVDGSGQDECAASEDCSSENQPRAEALTASDGDYCTGLNGVGIAYFQWRYVDPQSKSQIQYQLQISTDSSFQDSSQIIVDRTVYYTGSASGSLQQQLVLVKLAASSAGSDYINYNTNYYWRVRAKNSAGVQSEWINYDGSYTYGFSHPAPVVGYSSPSAVAPGSQANFTDSSYCYVADQQDAVYCNQVANSYLWDFGDSSTSTAVDNASHVYVSPNTYGTSLEVCDDLGCCSGYKSIEVTTGTTGDLPVWREVSPFSK